MVCPWLIYTQVETSLPDISHEPVSWLLAIIHLGSARRHQCHSTIARRYPMQNTQIHPILCGETHRKLEVELLASQRDTTRGLSQVRIVVSLGIAPCNAPYVYYRSFRSGRLPVAYSGEEAGRNNLQIEIFVSDQLNRSPPSPDWRRQPRRSRRVTIDLY
jgi:hypothetical protein